MQYPVHIIFFYISLILRINIPVNGYFLRPHGSGERICFPFCIRIPVHISPCDFLNCQIGKCCLLRIVIIIPCIGIIVFFCSSIPHTDGEPIEFRRMLPVSFLILLQIPAKLLQFFPVQIFGGVIIKAVCRCHLIVFPGR